MRAITEPARVEQPTSDKDIIYEEGFPEGWHMVHRTDTTLLIFRPPYAFMGFGQSIAAAPKLMQGTAWLDQAMEIAWAVSGGRTRALELIFDKFCDSCGMGPSCDENGNEIENCRALRDWTCTHCDTENKRPKKGEKNEAE